MAPPLIDLSQLDLTKHVVSDEEVRTLIPHRHEFQLIDGILHLDIGEGIVVGYKDWGPEPWWARGHIPDRPIMPGVLMVEGSAQVSTMLMKAVEGGWGPETEMIGLGGVDKARFRGVVKPPARCYFIAKVISQSRRIAKYAAQCVVDGKVVFEMQLLGIPL